MDTLTFISNIVKSLAWPSVVLTAIVLFRGSIVQVILSLKHVKYQELELDFGKELAELKTQVEQVAPVPTEETKPERELADSLQAQIEQVASISPASAVALAWTEVENELNQALIRVGIPSGATVKSVETLKQRGLIDPEIYHILGRLRYLRNKATHMTPEASGITEEAALEYGRLTAKVTAVLRSLK